MVDGERIAADDTAEKLGLEDVSFFFGRLGKNSLGGRGERGEGRALFFFGSPCWRRETKVQRLFFLGGGAPHILETNPK